MQLREALRRCEAYFTDRGKSAHWRAFEMKYIHPASGAHPPPEHAVIADELGFKTSADVGSALQVVRKRLDLFIAEMGAESGQPGEGGVVGQLG